jgi:hypothetical protein
MNSGSLDALIPGISQENVNTKGQATLQEIFIQNINNVQLYVPALSSTSTYPGIEAADQVIDALALHGGASTTLDLLSALGVVSCAVTCEIALIAFAGYEASEIFIHYQNVVNEQGYPYAPVVCNYVSQVLICPRGTEYVIFASANVTNVQVLSGTVLVVSAVTAQFATIGAGQQISIPGNQTQAGQQDLQNDITPFDASTANQWWPTMQAQKTSTNGQGGWMFLGYLWSSPLEMSFGVVAILVVVGSILAFRRKRRGGRNVQRSLLRQPLTAATPSSEVGAQVDVSMETLTKLTKLKELLDSNAISMEEYTRMKAHILDLQPSEAAPVREFCGSCGALVVPGTASCAGCGASLQRGRTVGWAAKRRLDKKR